MQLDSLIYCTFAHILRLMGGKDVAIIINNEVKNLCLVHFVCNHATRKTKDIAMYVNSVSIYYMYIGNHAVDFNLSKAIQN